MKRARGGTAAQSSNEVAALKQRIAELEGEAAVLRAEAARLRDVESSFTGLLGRAPLVAWKVDREGRFVESLGQGLARLGLRPGEALGRSLWEMYADFPVVIDRVRRALSGEEIAEAVQLGEITFESWVAPWRDAAGDIIGAQGIAWDVTDAVDTQTKLERSESFFQTLAKAIPVGIFRLTPDGRCYYWNEPASRLADLSAADAAERGWSDTIHPDDRRRLQDAWEQAVQEANPLLLECRFLRRDRSEVWVLVQMTPEFDAENQLASFTGTLTDITYRHRAERDLQFLAQILGHVDDAVLVADVEGRVSYWNHGAERLYGVSAETAIGRPHDEMVRYEWLNPGDHEKCLETLAAGGVWQGETRFVHPDGRELYTESSVRMLTGKDGEPLGYMSSTHDITDRKRAQFNLQDNQALLERLVKRRTRRLSRTIRHLKRTEQALVESESRMRSILDSTPAIIYVKNWDGRYLLINRAYEDAFKLPRETIENHTDHELFPAQWADRFRENDLMVLNHDEAIQFDEEAPLVDGPHSFVSVKFPLRDADGKIYAMCGISTDITDRKRAEARLRDEQEFLRRILAAHERDRQIIAYELHDGLVQEVAAAAIHLNAVERGLEQLPPTLQASFSSASALLRRAMEDGRRLLSGLRPPILDELGIVMAVKYLIAEQRKPGTLDIGFSADVQFERLEPLLEVMIFRIVQEALTNVRNHSDARKAMVTMTQEGDQLRIVVHDWGKGFDAAHAPPNRFGIQGIVKRAALMGGHAQVTSVPGEGTHVEVTLPISQSQAQ